MRKNNIYVAISVVIVLYLISIDLMIINNSRKQLSIGFSIPSVKSAVSSSTESQILNSSSTPSVKRLSEERIAISLKTGNNTYQVSIPKDSSVYDAMIYLSTSGTPPFIFKAENYPGIGYFIKEINGVKNISGKYWTLYVDSKYSTVGVSDYKLLEGDRIEWRYE